MCVLFLSTIAAFSAQPSISENVSLIQLIATPEKFDGHLVAVCGYMDMGREGDLLYLHQVDSENAVLSNAVWVRRTETMNKSLLNHRYVIVIGVFKVSYKEQLGSPPNGITDVKEVRIWSDPNNPIRDKIEHLPGVTPGF